MKNNAKSSITLPPSELQMVNDLMKVLKAKSKVEVIRRGLALLKESTERKALRDSYRKAVEATRKANSKDMEELDHLNSEGLDE